MRDDTYPMKLSITSLFLICACTVWGQVPEVVPRDPTFLRAIDILIDSIRVDGRESDKFVIAATIEDLVVTPKSQADGRRQSDSLQWPHSDYYWSYELSLVPYPYIRASNYHIPACKFHYRNRDVYLYFGLEYFVKYSERDLKRIASKVPRVVPEMKVGGLLVCRVKENKIISVSYVR